MTTMDEEQYRVTIVKYGTRSTVKSDVYLNYPLYGVPDEPVDMDYFFWVLQSSERTVIVDSGFSRAGGEHRNRTFLLDPAAAYDALGVDRSAAPTVIVTHAHYDHIGNLGLFPDSPLVLSSTEYGFWTGEYAARRQYAHSAEIEELEALAAAGDAGRVQLFEGSIEVAPGITVTEVGGHTAGQSIVTVRTSEGVVLLASDALHYYEEAELDRPFTYVNDLLAMYRAFDRINELVATGAVQHVVSGHDPSTLDRFTPVTEGSLAGLAATIGAAPEGNIR